MKCKQAQTLFSEYIDQALSPEELDSLSEHLAACPSCRQELQSWMDASAALSSVLDADAVPATPLDVFVEACTASAEKRPGLVDRVIEYLTAPRHAVASTVAGSFALTVVLLLAIWNGALATRFIQHKDNTMQFSQYRLAAIVTHTHQKGVLTDESWN